MISRKRLFGRMDALEKWMISGSHHTIPRRRPDIPIPYVLLLDIPLPVIPIPDIPKKKIGISIMFAVFLPNIPIPDIYTRFRNNEHNFTKKCSLFLQKMSVGISTNFLLKNVHYFYL